MSQDCTNQHQRRYAMDYSPIQTPVLQRRCLLKKKKMQQIFHHTKKKKTSHICLQQYWKIPELDFLYAEICGNLKFCLKNAISNKFVYCFRDKEEFLNLFLKFGWDLDTFYGESQGESTGSIEQQANSKCIEKY